MRQHGMTLLELLLVVTILSAVAFMTLSQVTDSSSQVRFELTQNRLEMIRKAIIGDTSRTINGQPEIRGFVADMGRLPVNIKELIEHPLDCDNDGSNDSDTDGNGLPDACEYTIYDGHCLDSTETSETACGAAGSHWYPDAGGLWAGWNGPYLRATPDIDGENVFRDGWGNDDNSNNFGWTADFSSNTVSVQSLGMDGTSGGSGYETDYPSSGSETLVTTTQYRTLITESNTSAQNDERGGLTVDFGTPSPCWRCSDSTHSTRAACETAGAIWSADSTITDSDTCTDSATNNGDWEPREDICLKISYRVDGILTIRASSGSKQYTGTESNWKWDNTPRSYRFSFEDTDSPYDKDFYLPQGQMAFGVFEHDGSSCTDNFYPSGSIWKPFSLVPGTAIQNLRWAVH